MSAMAQLYVKRIAEGRMTLAAVPAKWREEVRTALERRQGITDDAD